jgi:hypothetical protein
LAACFQMVSTVSAGMDRAMVRLVLGTRCGLASWTRLSHYKFPR